MLQKNKIKRLFFATLILTDKSVTWSRYIFVYTCIPPQTSWVLCVLERYKYIYSLAQGRAKDFRKGGRGFGLSLKKIIPWPQPKKFFSSYLGSYITEFKKKSFWGILWLKNILTIANHEIGETIVLKCNTKKGVLGEKPPRT